MSIMSHSAFELGQLYGPYAGKKTSDKLSKKSGEVGSRFSGEPFTEKIGSQSEDSEDWKANIPV